MQDVLAPVSAHGLGDRVEDGDPVVERAEAALAGRHPGHDAGPVVEHLAGVELALPAGDAVDDEPRVAADQDAHAAPPGGAGPPRPPSPAASSSVAAVSKRASSRRRAGLLGVRAHDPDDHRHLALLAAPGVDQPAGDLVAAGDAAEDVDEDRLHLRVGEDQAHGRRDPVGLGPAADVEEVGRLAAGALHEVHRRHRQAGAVDHAADRPVEVDEADVVAACLRVRRILLVEVAQLLQVGVAGQGGVVEGDLRVEAGEALDRGRRGRSRGRSPAG